MKPILTPWTIRLLAWRPDGSRRGTTRDPSGRGQFGKGAVAIPAALAVVIAIVMAVAPVAKPAPAATTVATDTTRKPDIVLILTDDQRFDTLWAMPTVEAQLVAKGIDFTNGFVSNSLCCPSRSSILTGKYSHSTGVYTNEPDKPYGGFPAFHDRSTIATWLHAAGYRTGLFGKYLNGYHGNYVPPGWDRWFATWDNIGYYRYQADANGKMITFGSSPSDYGTDVLTSRAVDFIKTTAPDQPLFLYLAAHAPHEPAIPASGDLNAFSDLAPWRPPSYNEANVTDKPAYIRQHAPLTRAAAAGLDRFRLDQYRCLLAVDRQVSAVLAALARRGTLSTSLIVFMSDNGMMWGEHRLRGKVVPYEEAIRVPFVVRDDALISSPRSDQHLLVNIDLAPTFAALAGVSSPGVEGRSFLPLLESPNAPWRSDFLLEHLQVDPTDVPSYCGVRSERYVYVDYGTGEEELYDLALDPLELTNLAHTIEYRSTLADMRRRLVQLCNPRPPGFSFSF